MLFTQLRRYCQVRSEHSDSPAGPAQRAERAEHAEQNGVLHILAQTYVLSNLFQNIPRTLAKQNFSK